MKYKLTDDKIFVYDKMQFNPKHILECGQIFRYQKRDDGSFVVFSGDKFALINEQADCYEITTSDVDYFEYFFDLKTDYQTIKNQLAINDTMQKAIDFGNGIRILNQQPLEMIISFII
ncbi:MAG: DNA glycosylase, partial [Christensenellales bacterium]